MQRPIGIVEAADIAGTTRKKVYAAMESGRLMWKVLDGHQATTKRWVEEWQGGRVR